MEMCNLKGFFIAYTPDVVCLGGMILEIGGDSKLGGGKAVYQRGWIIIRSIETIMKMFIS